MTSLKRLGDALLSRMVPRVEASAIYVWVYWCELNPCFFFDNNGNLHQGNQQRWRKRCHESSGGGCYGDEWVGCC